MDVTIDSDVLATLIQRVNDLEEIVGELSDFLELDPPWRARWVVDVDTKGRL